LSNCNIILISGQWENYHRKGFYSALKKENHEDEIVIAQFHLWAIINLIICIRKILSLIKSFGKLVHSNNRIQEYCSWIFTRSYFWINNALFRDIDTALISSQINKIIGNYSKDYKTKLWSTTQSIIF
jgi:hypothetical protein